MQSNFFLRSMLGAASVSCALTCFVACSAAPEAPAAGVVVTQSDASANAKPSPSNDASPGFNAIDAASATGTCEPPDMVLLLDRTLTMHRRPNGTTPEAAQANESKFAQAIAAIETIVAPPTDQGVRFGLTLWPKNPGPVTGTERCVTLVQRITNSLIASNPSCEGPEQIVAPALGTGASIQAALDPSTTRICGSTPTGAALAGAREALVATRVPGREQNIVLITDGADWDLTCPTPNPLDEVNANAAAGINTFIVGFEALPDAGTSANGGVGRTFLNDMACAGRTAKDFATACAPTGPNGAYRAVAPNGPTLYLAAETGAQLTAALQGAASSVCCNCIH